MSIIQKIEEACNLPQDILSNAPIIKMYGAYEIYISNYKGLLEFTDCFVVLQCYHCRVRICGKKLWIHSYDQSEMDIKGIIHTVSIITS